MPSLARTERDIELARAAAERVVRVHQRVSAWLRPGVTVAQIDAFVARTLDELDCKSCFLGYRTGRLPPFPSHACLSVNDCIVHGTAGSHEAPLKQGDVLKIDVGVSYKGWIGDAAWTYVFGEPAEDVRRLCDAGKTSLARGVEQLRPENTYLAWAQTVQQCVEQEFGVYLVRGLGGHGYGRKLHAPPFISNLVPRYSGEWPDGTRQCDPGTLVAVEPMVALGTGQTRQESRQWPIHTADGSLAAHYEHDVLITDNGPDVLTAELAELVDVIG